MRIKASPPMSRGCAASRFNSANLHKGVSAVHAACLPILAELDRIGLAFRAEGDPSGRFDPPFSSVHVGVIAGGTARNIVARDCAFQWEFRGLPGVASSAARDRLDVFT